ncbi:hypothetical protein SRABI83_00095 [Arthrobacter sp. Bi83]|uniref:nSTAND1 domain-containing NTPase n=1 Tax=Arthrobacter sp. Bi83 TaxID=2822353 RepID=UPI001D4D3468|nr:restriction endonuclease [Arthrobacter sp. Bi83]CAH0126500.1 hypothetical protein SRABI83_00095 [Arthrobacter sp. Bi83]
MATSDFMTQIGLVSKTVLVLAKGDSAGAVSHARGHLFELFVARLLQAYGYKEPSASNVTVNSNGIELDVVTSTRLDGRVAIAECKAYSQPVAAKELTNFYGKVTIERFTTPDALGLMMVVPGLTPSGQQAARAIELKDKNFKYMDVEAITDALDGEGLIVDAPVPLSLPSDFAVVVTEFGIYSAALELDTHTRLPVRAAVWAAQGGVPAPALELIASHGYSQGLEVWDARTPTLHPPAKPDSPDQVVLATVLPSHSDFQYQLPAGPKYFVGRKTLLKTLRGFIDSTSKTIIFNAQSGWGKSSLALKFAELIESKGGSALVMDSRTASSSRYVTEVLRRAIDGAVQKGLMQLGADVSWASLPSALNTIRNATWKSTDKPVLVFFDQFENVFRSPEITQSFRDLALGIRDIEGPIKIGFAWKTDLVGWIEGYPYQLRDEIRSASETVLVEPFGAAEVNTLLNRLQKKAQVNLGRDLRTRLREYSQGLPWLLKKLADHVLQELTNGTSPEQLLADSLNIQNLFDVDLAQLEPESLEILRHIAQNAPIPAGEVTDRYAPEAVQSLVDRRLIVQVGDRLDTYWDIFRDYLNTGRVPLEDSYILRSAPNQIARMLPLVMKKGGSAGVASLASDLKTSDNVIFNLSRELRLLGVTSYEPLTVRIVDDIVAASDPELAARQKVTNALRRHRAYSALSDVAAKQDGLATTEAFSHALPGIFPAVDATQGTWSIYARVFLSWFEYAGLASRRGNRWDVQGDATGQKPQRLLSPPSAIRSRPGVPQEAPRRSFDLLCEIASGAVVTVPDSSTPQRDALRTLAALGAVLVTPEGRVVAARADLINSDGSISRPVLLRLLKSVPGGEAGLKTLEADSSASPLTVGMAIREAAGGKWTESSTHSIGGAFRSWAKELGVKVEAVPRSKT